MQRDPHPPSWRHRLRSTALTGAAFALAAVALASALRGVPGHAADPLAYDVTIAPSGDAGLDKAAHDASNLIGLRENAPVGPFALIGRARGDLDRLETALHSYGYYDGHVAITVAGRSLDDLGLADALDALPAEAKVPVDVTLTPGQLFHLRQLSLPPDTPAVARDALKLAPGDPARAADVLAGRDRMLRRLARRRPRSGESGRAGGHAGAGRGRARRGVPGHRRPARRSRPDYLRRRGAAERGATSAGGSCAWSRASASSPAAIEKARARTSPPCRRSARCASCRRRA